MNTKLILTQNACQKMKYFTQLTEHEVSGIGRSELILDDDGAVDKILVTDIIIFKQECSGTNTTIEDGEQEKFFLKLAEKQDPTRKEWNIWWHSHASMGVFWSPTDETTIKDHIGLQPYLISIVTNKAGAYDARLDVFPKDTSAFKTGCYIKSELDVEIEETEEDEALDEEKTEVETTIGVLEDKKDKVVEKIDEQIEKEKLKLEEIEEVETGDPRIQKHCEKEIKAKVSTKVPLVQTWRNRRWQNTNRKQKWGWIDDYGDSILASTKKKRTQLTSVNSPYNPYDDPFYCEDDPSLIDWDEYHSACRGHQDRLLL